MSMLGVAIEDILGAAEMGRRLALRLLTLDDRDDRLDTKLCSLSKDVASTGVVLEQVALQLKQEERLRLFSAKSVALLKKLVDDCTTTFTELEEAVSGTVPTAAGPSDVHLLQEQHEKANFLLDGYLQHSKLVLLKTSLRVLLDVYRTTAEGLSPSSSFPESDPRKILTTLISAEVMNSRASLHHHQRRVNRMRSLRSLVESDKGAANRPANPYVTSHLWQGYKRPRSHASISRPSTSDSNMKGVPRIARPMDTIGDTLLDEVPFSVQRKERSVRPGASTSGKCQLFMEPSGKKRRPANTDELTAMLRFCVHANSCISCSNLHRSGALCDRGHSLLSFVLQYIHIQAGSAISLSEQSDLDNEVHVQIPAGCIAIKGVLEASKAGLTLTNPTGGTPVYHRNNSLESMYKPRPRSRSQTLPVRSFAKREFTGMPGTRDQARAITSAPRSGYFDTLAEFRIDRTQTDNMAESLTTSSLSSGPSYDHKIGYLRRKLLSGAQGTAGSNMIDSVLRQRVSVS